MAASDTQETGTLTRKRIKVTITKDMMIAMLVISKPEPGEPEVTVQEVLDGLAETNVVHGVDKELLAKSIQEKTFDTPVKIAQGTPLKKGDDSRFEYLFDIEHEPAPEEDSDGRIDYRNLNFIQNTTEGTVLVRKTPPTDGKNGVGVNGKEITAPRGRIIPFDHGENVKVSEDDSELIASADGAIVFTNGRVAVKDVLVIKGDVDFNIGNIDAVGSVKVIGKVQAGFTLNVGGDLEINGNCEDCNIKVKGNILIRGGFFGKGAGVMHADGDIAIKYAEGQRISAGNDLIVGGELLNCQVVAKEKVWVKGRRGKIVGGEINAGKQIRASVIGSDAGTTTVLTVAYDSDLMRQYHEATHERERITADHKRVKESLTSLYRLQIDGKLDDNQKVVLEKLQEFLKGVPQAMEALDKTKAELEERMKLFRDAKIIVEDSIYPGVQACVGVLRKEIEEESKGCVLTGDGFKVVMSPFDRAKDGV